jgi:hypothetical protein
MGPYRTAPSLQRGRIVDRYDLFGRAIKTAVLVAVFVALFAGWMWCVCAGAAAGG